MKIFKLDFILWNYLPKLPDYYFYALKITKLYIMTTTKKLLNDSFAARWTALVLIALMMFFAYMFVDVLSPLSTLLETSKGWSAETYGTFCSSEYFLNVFAFFLIFAGIILDKMGIRFTGILSDL